MSEDASDDDASRAAYERSAREWLHVRDPHDRLVRETLARPECAVDFIRTFLPADVVELFDLGSVEQLDGTWVDKEFRKHLSDVLFRVTLKVSSASAFLYVLIEHKSQPDRWTVLQLLRYAVMEWDRQRKADASAPLSVIVPVLLYHGPEQWTASTGLASLFGSLHAGLTRYVPTFECELIDLTDRLSREVPGDPILRAGLRVLAAVGRADLVERLTPLFRELALHGRQSIEYARLLVTYLVHASSMTKDDFRRVFAPSYSKEQEAMMPTLAQVWWEEGRASGESAGEKKGREEGRETGRREQAIEMAIELTAARFGDDVVTDSLRQAIEAASLDALRRLPREVLDCDSLDQLLERIADR